MIIVRLSIQNLKGDLVLLVLYVLIPLFNNVKEVFLPFGFSNLSKQKSLALTTRRLEFWLGKYIKPFTPEIEYIVSYNGYSI